MKVVLFDHGIFTYFSEQWVVDWSVYEPELSAHCSHSPAGSADFCGLSEAERERRM